MVLKVMPLAARDLYKNSDFVVNSPGTRAAVCAAARDLYKNSDFVFIHVIS
jgi:hypothetical protein